MSEFDELVVQYKALDKKLDNVYQAMHGNAGFDGHILWDVQPDNLKQEYRELKSRLATVHAKLLVLELLRQRNENEAEQ